MKWYIRYLFFPIILLTIFSFEVKTFNNVPYKIYMAGKAFDRRLSSQYKLPLKYTQKCDATCLALDPSHSRFFSGSSNGSIHIWNLETYECTYTLKAHGGSIRGLEFDTKRNWLLSAGNDHTIKMWDLNNLQIS